MFVKCASEEWFDSNIFLAISKINHSNHHYRYLVQSLMNKTSWSSIKGWH